MSLLRPESSSVILVDIGIMLFTSICWCIFSLGNQSSVEDDDWNLIYMAVTRAQRTVFMTRTITNILARAGVSGLDHNDILEIISFNGNIILNAYCKFLQYSI